jgi:arginine decarboxylase
MFELGLLDLDVKARVESLFWQLAERMQILVRSMDPEEVPRRGRKLTTELRGSAHLQLLRSFNRCSNTGPSASSSRSCRFTVERAAAARVDAGTITCDSDGKVSKFIDLNRRSARRCRCTRSVRPSRTPGNLPDRAYQDIMGDIHNLFGRVNEVHVFLDPDEESGFYIEEEIPGQPIGEVLAMTQWDWRDLEKRMKQQIDVAIKQDRVKPNEGMRLLQDFERGLKDQTYLTFE